MNLLVCYLNYNMNAATIKTAFNISKTVKHFLSTAPTFIIH